MNSTLQAAQYRSYAQTQRSPHNVAPRRGPGPMVGGPPIQSAQHAQHLAMQQRAAKIAEEAAKHRARVPTDKNMPEGIEELVIGSGVQEYARLRDIERRLDAVMVRKRLDLQEPRPQPNPKMKTMRIWISNAAENQPWQGKDLDENAFDFSSGTDATYRVRIVGKLLDGEESEEGLDSDDDDDDDEEEAGDRQGQAGGDAMDHDADDGRRKKAKALRPGRSRLSHFFKSINVEFDRAKNLQPDATTVIEWNKPPSTLSMSSAPAGADFDCLEFERKGDENINCTINLHLDETPERYTLSNELSNVLDLKDATRDAVISGIWEYVKAMELQQDEEKRNIQCDDRLRAVFKSDVVAFPAVPELILSHLLPLEPIRLPYTIRVDAEYQSDPRPTVYDVLVPSEDALRARMISILQDPDHPATLRQIAELDRQLALIIQAINNSKARHSFFTSMSKDPVTFIKRWVSSQKRDMEVIMGDARSGVPSDQMEWLGDPFRRGGEESVWSSQPVRESVGLMVAKVR